MKNSVAASLIFLLTLFVEAGLEQIRGWITTAEAQGSIALEPVVTGLTRPVGITHAGDGSGRLFITIQDGQILLYNGGQLLPTPFLDISSLVSCCGEQGLLGLAFHPHYASNGFFYVNYTNTVGDTVIARYSVSANPNVANPQSARTLLTIPQPFSNHNGGQLQFGPDGYLYIGTGDGGSGGDPQNNGQNRGTLLGKILRIDVDRNFPYAIPPDNPFVRRNGARREIWAFGLRNPWRFSFDRLTGDLFIGDVGQGSWEEIDFQQANSGGGKNYGWRLMEGKHCFNPSTVCDPGTLTLPILEYDHSLGCSVTGGYRYRGTQLPQLFGSYLYGDFCSGRIWDATDTGTGQWSTVELLDSPYVISTFGEDEAGELYFAHYTQDAAGAIYRLVSSLSLVASLLPSSRSVPVGNTATAFASIINQSGTVTATGCGLAPLTSLPATFAFQTTDCATNQLSGALNTPVDIPGGGTGCFLFALTPNSPIVPTEVVLNFGCTNGAPAPVFPGVNTFLFSASTTPPPDVIASGLPCKSDDYPLSAVNLPGATGANAVGFATTNVGADGTLTVAADTGSVSLPLTLTLCQTDPLTGTCINPSTPAPSVTLSIPHGGQLTFSVFAKGNGIVPIDLANNRIFMRFRDSGNIVRGATSVAVRTHSPACVP